MPLICIILSNPYKPTPCGQSHSLIPKSLLKKPIDSPPFSSSSSLSGLPRFISLSITRLSLFSISFLSGFLLFIYMSSVFILFLSQQSKYCWQPHTKLWYKCYKKKCDQNCYKEWHQFLNYLFYLKMRYTTTYK